MCEQKNLALRVQILTLLASSRTIRLRDAKTRVIVAQYDSSIVFHQTTGHMCCTRATIHTYEPYF